MKKFLPVLNLLALIVVLTAVVLRSGIGRSGTIAPQKIQEFAAELVNKGLYREAAAEYGRYLDTKITDANRRANTMYVLADLHMEKLRDYESALIWYLRLKNYYPDSKLIPEANKKIVACLEHLGRSLDARLALDDATAIEKGTQAQGTIIATVGSRKITDTEFARAMENVPPQMRKMLETKKGRINFLRQYIARDLVYNAARRMNLQDDAEIARQVADIRKELMVQAYLKKETSGSKPPDDGSVKMYFKAHKERYKDPDSGKPLAYDACRQQVAADCIRDREQQAYADMMERMLKAEDVMVYDDLVK